MTTERYKGAVIFKEAESEGRPRARSAEKLGAIWNDEELRDWPPLEWPVEPIRPIAPSQRKIWATRGLIALAVATLAYFLYWILDPSRRGDAWLFWPFFCCLAFRATWWVVEWI